MVVSVTVDQMREVDRAMIEDIGIDLLMMMENAGRNLAALARRLMRDDAAGKSVTVLAGSGNNGGGSLAAARHLRNAGAAVRVVLTEQSTRLKEAPAKQFSILREMGVDGEVFSGDVAALAGLLGTSEIILDGLLGYSIAGAPRGAYATLIRAANASRVPTLALDLPSGLNPDNGEPFDPCIKAKATMTLALPKRGLIEEAARDYVGDLYVADISVPAVIYKKMGLEVGPIFSQDSIIRLTEFK